MTQNLSAQSEEVDVMALAIREDAVKAVEARALYQTALSDGQASGNRREALQIIAACAYEAWMMRLSRLSDPAGSNRRSIPALVSRIARIKEQKPDYFHAPRGLPSSLERGIKKWEAIDNAGLPTKRLSVVRAVRNYHFAHNLQKEKRGRLPFALEVVIVHDALITSADCIARGLRVSNERLAEHVHDTESAIRELIISQGQGR